MKSPIDRILEAYDRAQNETPQDPSAEELAAERRRFRAELEIAAEGSTMKRPETPQDPSVEELEATRTLRQEALAARAALPAAPPRRRDQKERRQERLVSALERIANALEKTPR